MLIYFIKSATKCLFYLTVFFKYMKEHWFLTWVKWQILKIYKKLHQFIFHLNDVWKKKEKEKQNYHFNLLLAFQSFLKSISFLKTEMYSRNKILVNNLILQVFFLLSETLTSIFNKIYVHSSIMKNNFLFFIQRSGVNQ